MFRWTRPAPTDRLSQPAAGSIDRTAVKADKPSHPGHSSVAGVCSLSGVRLCEMRRRRQLPAWGDHDQGNSMSRKSNGTVVGFWPTMKLTFRTIVLSRGFLRS